MLNHTATNTTITPTSVSSQTNQSWIVELPKLTQSFGVGFVNTKIPIKDNKLHWWIYQCFFIVVYSQNEHRLLQKFTASKIHKLCKICMCGAFNNIIVTYSCDHNRHYNNIDPIKVLLSFSQFSKVHTHATNIVLIVSDIMAGNSNCHPKLIETHFNTWWQIDW